MRSMSAELPWPSSSSAQAQRASTSSSHAMPGLQMVSCDFDQWVPLRRHDFQANGAGDSADVRLAVCIS